MRIWAGALVISLVVISGCLGADEHDEPELSETSQPVTWTTVHYYDCTGSCIHVVVGRGEDQTCFLAGVTGHLNQSFHQNPGGHYVYLDAATNKWRLTSSGYPSARSVGVTCISTTVNRVFAMSHNSVVSIPGSTAARQCFLSGLSWNYDYGVAPGYGDTAKTYSVLGNWYVKSYLENDTVDAFAYAVCVDVPVKLGTFAFGHDAGGSTTQPLTTVQNSGACGLMSLNGFAGTGAPWPSVRINDTPPNWTWTFDEHVGGTAACVQPF